LVRFRRTAATDETSDEALVVRALGDRQAFALLYDRYVGPNYRYCYGRLGDREEAEDATSVFFARALAALSTQRGASFRSWLFTIAHPADPCRTYSGSCNQTTGACDFSPTVSPGDPLIPCGSNGGTCDASGSCSA
jgi:hypothetical protein